MRHWFQGARRRVLDTRLHRFGGRLCNRNVGSSLAIFDSSTSEGQAEDSLIAAKRNGTTKLPWTKDGNPIDLVGWHAGSIPYDRFKNNRRAI
jgi:hypothetical protein